MAVLLKVFAAIAAYSSIQNAYLDGLLAEYTRMCEFGHHVRVVVQTADDWSPDDILQLNQKIVCERSPIDFSVSIDVYDKIGDLLTTKHRGAIAKVKNEFDVYIYSEDDMVITLEHVNAFYKDSVELSNGNVAVDLGYIPVVGFYRFEYLNQKRYFIDDPKIVLNYICVADKPYLVDAMNPHQALWMLTNDQLNMVDRAENQQCNSEGDCSSEMESATTAAHACHFLSQPDNVRIHDPRGTKVYMSSFSLYLTNPRVMQLCGVLPWEAEITDATAITSGDISCELLKIYPAWQWETYGVHHSRQRYVQEGYFSYRDYQESIMEEWHAWAVTPSGLAALASYDHRQQHPQPAASSNYSAGDFSCWRDVIDAWTTKPSE